MYPWRNLPAIARDLRKPAEAAMWPLRVLAFMTYRMEGKTAITIEDIQARCRLFGLFQDYLEGAGGGTKVVFELAYFVAHHGNPFLQNSKVVTIADGEGNPRLGVISPIECTSSTSDLKASDVIPTGIDRGSVLDSGEAFTTSTADIDALIQGLEEYRKHLESAEVLSQRMSNEVQETWSPALSVGSRHSPSLFGGGSDRQSSRAASAAGSVCGSHSGVSRGSLMSEFDAEDCGGSGSLALRTKSRNCFDANLYPLLIAAPNELEFQGFVWPKTKESKKLQKQYLGLRGMVFRMAEPQFTDVVTNRALEGLTSAVNDLLLIMKGKVQDNALIEISEGMLKISEDCHRAHLAMSIYKQDKNSATLTALVAHLTFFKGVLERLGTSMDPEYLILQVRQRLLLCARFDGGFEGGRV